MCFTEADDVTLHSVMNITTVKRATMAQKMPQ